MWSEYDETLAALPILAPTIPTLKSSPLEDSGQSANALAASSNPSHNHHHKGSASKADQKAAKNAGKAKSISRVSETIPTTVADLSTSLESVGSMKESLQDFGLTVPWGAGASAAKNTVPKGGPTAANKEQPPLNTAALNSADAASRNAILNSTLSGSTTTLVAVPESHSPPTASQLIDSSPSANLVNSAPGTVL